MVKSSVLSRSMQLIFSLSKREQSAFRQFLASPYHNRRADICDLAEEILRYELPEMLPDKTVLWKEIYNAKPFDDQTWRLLQSNLSRQVERFLAVEATLEDEFELKMRVAAALQGRSQNQLHAKLLRESRRLLEKEEIQNAEYWLRSYRYQEAYYRQSLTQRPEKDDDFAQLSQSLDRAFMAMKLRQNMWLLNHAQVYQWGWEPSDLDQYIADLPSGAIEDVPALRLYYNGIQVLQQAENEELFKTFTTSLFSHAASLPESEARDLYLLAINFGVRQVNSGRRSYFQQVMALYRSGLEQGYLLRNGVLSRFTYHNIVSAALQIEDIAYAEAFIEQWTEKLERRYRNRMYNFSRAKIAYVGQRYEEALPLLQQANYHDLLLNLGARTLLLKIYYELGEWEVLQSHLDAFSSYLRRKPGISYHRTNYRNLIRYTRRLLKLQSGNPEERASLLKSIKAEATLTEKEWLLGMLGEGEK